ncbi:ShlB/FhaC/HecB family hemolysin secretion/activation protein, partial [[Haemophilus] felis]|nr:ShlB/FhaC/HecB family hemolysin secretion/activation protein [[Haemophilus] felis]
MKSLNTLIFGAVYLTLATPVVADKFDIRLNNIDATQQQRQEQHQQALVERLQSQADVRLDTAQQGLVLPAQESLCFPIEKITLVDYSAQKTSHQSQFH